MWNFYLQESMENQYFVCQMCTELNLPKCDHNEAAWHLQETWTSVWKWKEYLKFMIFQKKNYIFTDYIYTFLKIKQDPSGITPLFQCQCSK